MFGWLFFCVWIFFWNATPTQDLNTEKMKRNAKLNVTIWNLLYAWFGFVVSTFCWNYSLIYEALKVLFPPNPPPPPPSSCLFPASHSLQTLPFHSSFSPSSFFAVIYFIEVSSCSAMVACACALSNIMFFSFLTICLSKMCSVGAVSFQESIWKAG